MEVSAVQKLRYPIGKFTAPTIYTKNYLSEKIEEIASFPEKLKKEVAHLTTSQLDTRYREGWLDGAPSNSPLRRKSYELLHKNKMDFNRKQTSHKTI